MFQEPIVSPSILSADFAVLGAELAAIEEAGTDWVHFDVIDGVFAPNVTFGVPILKQVRKMTSLPIDAHLMLVNPLEKLPWFLDCGPDYVTIHLEALLAEGGEEAAQKAVALIHDAGARAGVALKPDLPIDALGKTLGLWDMILVMSVFPGFSGQSFIEQTPERIHQLVEACTREGCAPLIQVDGGIDPHTAPLVASEGADVFVAGNAVFKHPDYREAISAIRQAAKGAQARRQGA